MKQLLCCSLGRFVTVFGSFSACHNKLVTQAAAVPYLHYLRKTMHYQTEERGRPNSPDYRIYFSKLSIVAVGETMSAPYISGDTWFRVQLQLCNRV